jgi:hypothetical protein
MTKNGVRSLTGLTLVASHVLMLAAILVAPYLAVLTWDESIGFTQVIGPLFAGFTTAIIRYFVKNPAVVVDHREAKVSFPYVVVSLLPAGMLVFLVALEISTG